MIVTSLKYHMEKPLIGKLNLLIKRVTTKHPKRDALVLVEGAEGEGKTNTACAIAFYIKDQTERPVHLFFKLETMLEFAQTHYECIIIWDEPALDSLSTDWYKQSNKDLIRLLMLVRKNRHFFIFCLTKFHKFAEYIVVDRALALIHMYTLRGLLPGRFVYIKHKPLEWLWLAYRRSGQRMYGKFGAFRGTVPEVLEKYFDKMDFFVELKPHATYLEYDKIKDDNIRSIGMAEKNKKKQELEIKEYKIEMKKEALKLTNELRVKIHNLTFPINNKTELAKKLGYSPKTIKDWSEFGLKNANKSE